MNEPLTRMLSRRTVALRWSLVSLTGLALLLNLALPLTRPHASNPSAGTINPTDTTPQAWTGTATGGADANGEAGCTEGQTCDSYTLTVSGQPTDWTNKRIHIQISWTLPATDYDLYVHKDS